MKIKGNITVKDNNKLVYANIVLLVVCAYFAHRFYSERNYKEIVAIDSAHEIYHGRMIRISDKEATIGQVKAHLNLGFTYLYSLSEYTYPTFIPKALHLWAQEGVEVVTNYEKESLLDLLTSTPTRTECLVMEIEVTGEKMVDNLQYPVAIQDSETGSISFRNEVATNVKTYMATVKSYHRIIRGAQILSEEIHTEELEVYTGFGVDSDVNPFGMKAQTITRKVERIIE